MIYTVESTGLVSDYELVEGPGSHPTPLALLDDGDVWELQSSVVERTAQMISENPDPDAICFGKGAVLYLGYDAEWDEPVPGQLAVQSYQFYAIGVGGDFSVVFSPRSVSREGRLTLQEMLVSVIEIGLRTGCIIEMPERVELVGFFLRADLAVTADLPLYKGKLTNVGGKFASTGEPVHFEARYRAQDVASLTRGKTVLTHSAGANWILPVRFIDVAKHAPERKSLDALGELIGKRKIELPPGYRKDRIGLFKAGDYPAFCAYGVRDAEIAVLYWLKVREFSMKYANCDNPPASAGALAVKLCLQTIEQAGGDYATLFGVEQVTRSEWQPVRGQRRTSKLLVPNGERKFHESFVIDCYHGGRNECYFAGPTPVGEWFDYDLKGAYTTGLAVLRPIDYSASFETDRLKDFLGDVMGFAWAEFEFPAKIRHPGLPVRSDLRGLIFPVRGVSYCTAPELAVAHAMGARIRIKRGVVYPWVDDDGDRMFVPFVKLVRELREGFERSGQSFFDEYAKLLGNSVYGKTAQALHGASAFDLASESSRSIGPSSLSNAPFAAHATGLVRAVMSELLAGIPPHRQVASCVTDGILTNARIDELRLDGEMCRRFADCLQRVEGPGVTNPSILKVKHEVQQVLSMRTRAQATLVIAPEKKVLLAKGSISPPPECTDANAYMVDLYLNRKPGQKTLMRPFVSPRDQIVREMDVTRLKREVTMNLCYDMKRRPIGAHMQVAGAHEHLAFDTAPWETDAEALLARSILDEWRKTRVLKTLDDYADWDDYYLSVSTLERLRREGARHGLQVTAVGSVGILQRVFLRAYVKGKWGLENNLPYREVAERLTRCGCPTSVDDVKNGTRGKLTPNVVPVTPRARAMFAKMKKVFVGLDAKILFAESKGKRGKS